MNVSAVVNGEPPLAAAYHLKVLPLAPGVPLRVAVAPEQIEVAGTVGIDGIGLTVTSTEARALSHSVVELKLLT